jgi:hypothetical protein
MPPCSAPARCPAAHELDAASGRRGRALQARRPVAPEVLVVLDPVLEIGVREVELLLVAHLRHCKRGSRIGAR